MLAYVWRVVRDYAPAAYWTAGSVLIAVGALLAGLREIAPISISVTLAQACIVPGWMLVDAGTVIAAGGRVPWRPAIAMLVALLPLLAWYTFGDPDYVARTVVTTLPAVLFDCYALLACLRVTSGRRVTTLRLLAVAVALMIVSNLWKLLGAASLQTTSLLQHGLPLIQFLLVSMVSFIVSTGLYVLLAAQWLQEQLDQELLVRKQAEADLKRHQEQLESLVRDRTAELESRNIQLAQTQFAMDRVGIGVAWNEIETGRFIHANNEACRQLGCNREELLALGVSDINPEVTPAVLGEIAAKLRVGDGRLRLETIHRRKDGSTYPVEVTVHLHEFNGKEWFIVFYNDITARKAAEADLVTAKEAAEAASRAKSAFLATMSHEMRTPMNAIMGMNYIARQRSKDPAVLECLDKIDVGANKLLRMINEVLDLVEIEAARLELKPAEFRLGDILATAQRLVADHVADKGLAFEVRLPEQLAAMPLFGDHQRLGQILNCLVENAIKFTPRGAVTLAVDHHDAEAGTIQLRFEVTDTGIGIDAADLARVFNSFEQADMSNTRRYGGVGLGLAIARRLARLMGGDMGVASTHGQGSRFWFTVRVGVVRA